MRRRATGRIGMVRCERCGSEEGPFDYNHTTEGYRYLGEEVEHWMENSKSGSDGFEVETSA